MKTRLTKVVQTYSLLLENIPTIITISFVLSVVVMNILASKVMFQFSDYAAGDCGYLISWIPFLCMDTVTKRFGAKASILLNLLGAAANVLCCILFAFCAWLPSGNGEDFSAFNSTLGGVWFITLSSMTAYIISGIFNSLSNEAIGNLFKKNPDGKLAFFTRSYVSTFFGQALDNFIFSFLTYHIFAAIFWGWSFSIPLCLGSAVCGGIFELIMEIIFSPIGYRLSVKWQDEKVGQEWIDTQRSVG